MLLVTLERNFILSCREICHHKEAYVRRAVLFAASCTLTALRPSFIASSLLEGNLEVSRGLEWIRTWALEVAESDPDRECYSVSLNHNSHLRLCL